MQDRLVSLGLLFSCVIVSSLCWLGMGVEVGQVRWGDELARPPIPQSKARCSSLVAGANEGIYTQPEDL